MKKAYILIGPSGAGKSTKVNHIQVAEPGTEVFSLDLCRLAFFPVEKFDYTKEESIAIYRQAFDHANSNSKEFDAFVDKTWKETLAAESVIVDNTNLTRKSRARWVQDLRKNGFSITMIEFLVPLNTLIERQSTRPDKSIPLDAVRAQYYRQEAALLGSECDEIEVIAS